MSDAAKTSQSFDRYECWRPAFESISVVGWIIAFGWVTWLYVVGRLPLNWCAILWVISFFMVLLRSFQTLKVLSARAALSGAKQTFMTFEELARIMKGKRDELWLGIGFRW